MWRDLRFILRQLAGRRGFTLVAVLSLALGVGLNATIFSLIDGLYLRPMGVTDPNRIVSLEMQSAVDTAGPMSYPEFEVIRDSGQSFTGLAALMRRGSFLLLGERRHLLRTNVTSPEFFSVMGAKPLHGRAFAAGDGEPLVLLGHDAWRRLFGGDPDVVGRSLRLTEGLVTVAGVLPPEFRDTRVSTSVDIWASPAAWASMVGGSQDDFTAAGNRIYEVYARLKDGVSEAEARQEVERLGEAVRVFMRPGEPERRLRMVTSGEKRWRDAGDTPAALLAIVGLVALIACVNVANLLLTRTEARRRELAVRAALGAPQWLLARLFLMESVVLGAMGLAAGLAFASWLIEALPVLLVPAPGFPATEVFALDRRVLAATAAAAVFTMVVIGFSSLLTIFRLGVMDAFRGASGSGGRWPLRDWLAVGQVAIAVVLLAGASVLGASFWQTRTVEIGLTRENPMVAWVVGHTSREAAQQVAALPGVRRAAVAMRAPMSLSGGGMSQRVALSGQPVEVRYNTIDENYLNVMGLRLLRGRNFTSADMGSGARVALISEAFARRHFPELDPVGLNLTLHGNDEGVWEIAGVVGDAPSRSVTEAPEPYFYLPYWQARRWDMTLLLIPDGDREALVPAVRKTLAAFGPGFEPSLMTSFDDLRRYSTRQKILLAELAGTLAAVGLMLTAVGLYGVLAHGVARRRREIGIRMALGAGAGSTLRLVVRRTLGLTLAGVAAGLPMALYATNQVRSLLFGVPPWHPPAFVLALLAIGTIAMLAAYLPARQAVTVNPIEVLRQE